MANREQPGAADILRQFLSTEQGKNVAKQFANMNAGQVKQALGSMNKDEMAANLKKMNLGGLAERLNSIDSNDLSNFLDKNSQIFNNLNNLMK